MSQLADIHAERLAAIAKNIELMRWADADRNPPDPGSLADVFWNQDVPDLMALRFSPRTRRSSATATGSQTGSAPSWSS